MSPGYAVHLWFASVGSVEPQSRTGLREHSDTGVRATPVPVPPDPASRLRSKQCSVTNWLGHPPGQEQESDRRIGASCRISILGGSIPQAHTGTADRSDPRQAHANTLPVLYLTGL